MQGLFVFFTKRTIKFDMIKNFLTTCDKIFMVGLK